MSLPLDNQSLRQRTKQVDLSFTALCLVCKSYAQTDTLAADTTDSKKHKVHKTLINNDGLTLGVSFGLAQSFRTIESKKSMELVTCRDHHETAILVPEIGLTIGYEFNKHFQIASGLGYFQSGFDFSEDRAFSDTLTYEMGVGCDVYHVVDPNAGYVGIGLTDPRLGFVIEGLHPDHGELTVKPRYHYLDIPLVAKFTIGKNRLRGFAMAGASVNYMFYQTLLTEVTSDGVTYAPFYSKGTPWSIYNRWNFSALARVGIDYRLNESVSIGLEVAARYQLRNLFGKSWGDYEDYREHHYNAGLKLGGTYHF